MNNNAPEIGEIIKGEATKCVKCGNALFRMVFEMEDKVDMKYPMKMCTECGLVSSDAVDVWQMAVLGIPREIKLKDRSVWVSAIGTSC